MYSQLIVFYQASMQTDDGKKLKYLVTCHTGSFNCLKQQIIFRQVLLFNYAFLFCDAYNQSPYSQTQDFPVGQVLKIGLLLLSCLIKMAASKKYLSNITFSNKYFRKYPKIAILCSRQKTVLGAIKFQTKRVMHVSKEIMQNNEPQVLLFKHCQHYKKCW